MLLWRHKCIVQGFFPFDPWDFILVEMEWSLANKFKSKEKKREMDWQRHASITMKGTRHRYRTKANWHAYCSTRYSMADEEKKRTRRCQWHKYICVNRTIDRGKNTWRELLTWGESIRRGSFPPFKWIVIVFCPLHSFESMCSIRSIV